MSFSNNNTKDEERNAFKVFRQFLSIQYVHGDLCKNLGIDSSTDLDDRYSNLFFNAYINRHVHAEYLKNDLIL